MSTVLTKPVLLDETGQAIVDKLEDIQQAIGGTGEFIPINIRVTTPPTKTNYLAGEALDLSGMVVTLVANNGGMYDVTGDCVFSPADGSTVTSSTTEVNISYTWYKDSTVFTAKQPLSIKELSSIAVTTPPTLTEYYAGDELDLTGIVVTATYNDGTSANVTNECVFSPADGDELEVNDTTINISYTLGTITKSTTQALSIEVAVYGVEWVPTQYANFVRTDQAADFVDPNPYYAGMSTTPSSPFDNIMPWRGMTIEERTEGTCVKIPKFWYKLTSLGDGGIKIQITNAEKEGFEVSPAHMDRGDGQGERDLIYVGRYLCANGTYESGTDNTPATAYRKNARTAIAALGNDVWQFDFATWFTIWLLYLVEFAHWNSQAKIGYGCGDNGITKTGYTDSMPYHTGTTATARDSYDGGIQYRHIESMWDFNQYWVDGCRGSTLLIIILDPSQFSDSTGGTNIAQFTTGYPYKLQVQKKGDIFTLFMPSQSEQSPFTIQDTWTSNGPNVHTGASPTGKSQAYGLFYFAGDSTTAYTQFASRLMELPANT